MRKKTLLGLSLSCLYFFFCGCYDVTVNHQLSITNKLNIDISILYSNDINPGPNENDVAFYLSNQSITKPDSSRDIIRLGGKHSWLDYIEEGKTKKLFLYVFESDTLEKYNNTYSMYELVSRHKFLKVLTYSEDNLDKINWRIIIR
jgi:hypothetical protein